MVYISNMCANELCMLQNVMEELNEISSPLCSERMQY